MRILNNTTDTIRDDLAKIVKRGDRLSVAAACFSIYAWQALKEQLERLESFRFIFTSPTFTPEKSEKQKREFYIPRLTRETGLYGTEFEIRLRNALTQKAVARECAAWIRRKAIFKSNTTSENMIGFMALEREDGASAVYMPINGFTTADIGCTRGNNAYNLVSVIEEAPHTRQFLKTFDELWNDSAKMQTVTNTVVENIETAYAENAPELIYFLALYHIFSEYLGEISDDTLPNERTGFRQSKIWEKLYDFQKDAVLAVISKLEKYNGCILADSVGLGKTFTALAVIKYYENRNKSVLVLCPKKLEANWNTYKDNYVNNPVADDRLNYDVLFHTDLSRDKGRSNGLDLARLNWGNYDLIVIDESHNFRNGNGTHFNTQENRYKRLMEKVIRSGVRTKVLMLSATPLNNRFTDLKNQLALAYEGDASNLSARLETETGIDQIFRQAQSAFNAWSKLDPQQRTTENLLKELSPDLFKLLDAVTIARSRKHIERCYDTAKIGKFPTRLPPISERARLTDLSSAATYAEISEKLSRLKLTIYTPSAHIHESRAEKYGELFNSGREGLTQHGREAGIQRLMSVNLLKRLESSVHAFRLTLERIRKLIHKTVDDINRFERGDKSAAVPAAAPAAADWDADDAEAEIFFDGKTKISLADMDYKTWREELQADERVLSELLEGIRGITPEHDLKLRRLVEIISEKIENPINGENRKVIVFSAFSDTAEYLYEHVSAEIGRKYGLNSALVTGSAEGRTNAKGVRSTLGEVLACFSPLSKERALIMPECRADIDVLVATDCISEGQNLQDCDYLINYDIHWNPVRIIQRFGRIDRIGSRNEKIRLVNFWPDMDLDEYINLKSRVETRMKAAVAVATGDGNPINAEGKGDLEYRTRQLRRLQNEVVDIEDLSDGFSLTNLGLDEFRLDLLEYRRAHGDLEHAPRGLHAVVPAAGTELPPGAIFVLKNRTATEAEPNSRNRVHPFYLVYVGADGGIVRDHLSPKNLLDDFRRLCRGRNVPVGDVCAAFNRETDDGENMATMSALLSRAVRSIRETKDESDVDSLFSPGETSALKNEISGLDDFELICFLVVK